MPLTYYANGIYRAMSSGHVVIETAGFLRDVRQAGIAEAERSEIVSAFARNPSSGEQIVGTGGACKTRFGGRGKGKSGGCRVISYYAGSDIPVFLLAVFSKGERVDLSQADPNQLRGEPAGLAADHRRAGNGCV